MSSTIGRAARILDLLAQRGAMGVRAIAQHLQLPLGSVHRILLDLADEDFIERTPVGEWEMSFRLLGITGLQLDRMQLPQLARPFAERIAEQTGETVNVNALGNLTGVCIDKVRGKEGMQLDLRIGSRGPLYCGGAGKAMLAWLSPEDQARVFDMPMEPLTVHTISDRKVLRQEVERIRQRGYSVDDQEVVMGVYCVAVPIFDRHNRPVGAISITGPSVKRPGPELKPLVDLLNDVCGHVSRRLGYGGVWPPGERGQGNQQPDLMVG